MTGDALIEILIQEMTAFEENLAEDDYLNALSTAQYETWTMPQTDGFRIYWIKERCKRHLFFFLASGQAMSFKVKAYNLNEKFKHLREIYRDMDAAFEKVKAAFPDAFPTLSDGSFNEYEAFGTYIGAGFQYNNSGKDTTYETSNSPLINPSPDEDGD